jgi:hypothetical protein
VANAAGLGLRVPRSKRRYFKAFNLSMTLLLQFQRCRMADRTV